VPRFDIVVVGASAGGVTYLQRVIEHLPADFPAAIFITLHLPESARSMMPRILERVGSLPAEHAQHGAPIRRGRIYVAPPGFHMTVDHERMRLSRGAREHGHRPAIDPLFRSAAVAFGPRAIGVILSGLLDDGTVGLLELKRAGGIAIVQDPDDTAFPSMPRSAIAHVSVDHVAPADQIGHVLQQLVMEHEPANPIPNGEDAPDRLAAQELRELTVREDEREHPGEPSPYSCPECGGVLWEIKDDDVMRLRCRVGHAYTGETLSQEQARTVEGSLWMAVRALEEQGAVKRRLAERARRARQLSLAERLDRRVRELEQHADDIRALLLDGVGAASEP
jgi:two-component system chemotaxis response regulator CheB